MATRPKAVIESRNGEEFSPITIAKNVLTDDGQSLHDILSDRKEDMMTPTIENSSSMFKVGQGDNVDYSSNVVNGAYEDIVLKGKSMVNSIQEPSSKDVVLPYAFEEGRYVTINDTKESGALGVELKGQTLVNLCNNVTFSKIDAQYGFWEEIPNALRVNIIKDKKYFIRANVETNSFIDGGQALRLKNEAGEVQWTILSLNQKQGVISGSFTAEINGTILQALSESFSNTGSLVIKEIIIIEYQEGMENWDIPYFEGMTSCKMPILHTVGKNLATVSNVRLEGIRSNSGGHPKNIIMKNIPVEEGKTYTISGIGSKSGNMNGISFTRYEHRNPTNSNNHSQLWNEIGRDNADTTFTIPKGIKYVSFTFGNCVYNNNGEDGWLQWDSIQLEEGSVATAYEPYKSSILSLPEEAVLRSLPNGVCDTFNTRTGVYTQRIGEVVLDGSDSVNDWVFSESNNTFRTSFNKHGIIPFQGNRFVHVISDKYTTLVYADDWNSGAFVSMDINNKVVFRDDRFSSLIDWHNSLKQDAITVQYILETPVTTKINLPSTLKSWNTTTHIYSEIPENTLYPTLSHSNPSYPVILKPSTKYSIVTNSYSNGHTNSPINFNLGGATTSTTVGNRVTTITTPSTLSNELLTMSGRGNKLNNVMVIEEDVVGDEPYFEGICDCKSPILLNCGKNISPINTYETTVWEYAQGYQGFDRVLAKNIVVDENKTYTLTFDKECESGLPSHLGNLHVMFSNSPAPSNYTGHNAIYTHCQNNSGKRYAHITMPNIGAGSNYIGKKVTLTNIQLRESSTLATYEPYKSNTTTFDQKDDKTIVLRSLPNGVCDTLNVETGEYTRKIGEIIIDGSENWKLSTRFSSTYNSYYFVLNEAYKNKMKCISDKYQILLGGEDLGKNIGLHMGSSDNNIAPFISSDKMTLSEFKEYLQQNPVTVQYELATPIVSTVDIQGFPFSYKNGHVQLSSGSIEQSLTPKVEYSVVTNRNGQIRSNQKMVERHQKQLDRLQAMILTNLVNTQYEQTLTNLKYDLKNVREEVK